MNAKLLNALILARRYVYVALGAAEARFDKSDDVADYARVEEIRTDLKKIDAAIIEGERT